MKKSIIILSLLLVLGISGSCLAMDMLSPRLLLEKDSLRPFMQKDPEAVYPDEADEDFDPEEDGPIIYRMSLDGKKLLVRKNSYDSKYGAEVNFTLNSIDSEGNELYEGQCWYTVDQQQAVFSNGLSFVPAISVVERGAGYGRVLFAAVLESARADGINRFLVIDATTALYESFGFIEIPGYGMHEKIISKDDVSAFVIARKRSEAKGLDLQVEGMPFLEIEAAQFDMVEIFQPEEQFDLILESI